MRNYHDVQLQMRKARIQRASNFSGLKEMLRFEPSPDLSYSTCFVYMYVIINKAFFEEEEKTCHHKLLCKYFYYSS